MGTLSEHFDVDVEKKSGKLAKGGSVEITEALGFYRKTFIPEVQANEKLVGLLGYWCEGFLKSLLNKHLSPAQRKEILCILCTDFSIQMLVSELRSYYWGAQPKTQREILELAHDKTVPEKLQQVITSVQKFVEGGSQDPFTSDPNIEEPLDPRDMFVPQ